MCNPASYVAIMHKASVIIATHSNIYYPQSLNQAWQPSAVILANENIITSWRSLSDWMASSCVLKYDLIEMLPLWDLSLGYIDLCGRNITIGPQYSQLAPWHHHSGEWKHYYHAPWVGSIKRHQMWKQGLFNKILKCFSICSTTCEVEIKHTVNSQSSNH